MSDNFTNNVHDIMEGFQLAPSEDVWLKVQQGIQKEKKRKPKFFWWLFPLLALLVGGTYLMMQSNHPNNSNNQATNRQVANAQQTRSTQNEMVLENSTNNKIVENEKETAVIDDTEIKDDAEIKADAKTSKTSIASPVVKVKKNETAKENVSLTPTVSFTNSNTAHRNVDESLNHENHFVASRTKKQKKQKQENSYENSNGEAGDYAAPIIFENNEENNLLVETDVKPLQTISSFELNKEIQKPKISIAPIKENLNFSTQDDATNKPSVKPRKWHLQIVAGAGTSNLSSGLSGLFDAQKSFIRPSSIVLPSGNFTPASDIKPNAFYNVGLEISYDLQKRLQFNTGLHFISFNNSIQVGSLVSSPTRFFDVNGQFLFEKDAFYTNNNSSSNTNQFNNQYMFINMPLRIDYEFARLRTMRFHVQTGFDLGYLLSNESMIFDSRTNIYYAPTTELNKWRYGLHMGVSVSLMKDQLSINPMFHLGLNDLYNAGSYNNLSLSSFGLQLKLRIK